VGCEALPGAPGVLVAVGVIFYRVLVAVTQSWLQLVSLGCSYTVLVAVGESWLQIVSLGGS
jgi:hypothetical protein